MQAATPVDALVGRLLDAPETWSALIALEDRDRFVTEVTALAARWDLDLTPDDVRTALDGRRREWLERWV